MVMIVCRLSTKPYVMDSLDDNFATVWRWYWKDNSGWIAYADVCIQF